MGQVYLLLRNNIEKGPYTLEELIQQNLKNDDLIWVEGKSSTWVNPTELEYLKPYITGLNKLVSKVDVSKQVNPTTPNNNNNKIAANTSTTFNALDFRYVYVEAPHNTATSQIVVQDLFTAPPSLEQKAEILKKKAIATTAEIKIGGKENVSEKKRSPIIVELEKEHNAWLLNQKRKKKRQALNKIFLVVFVVVGLGAGFVLAKSIIQKKEKKEIVAIKDQSKQTPATTSAIKVTSAARPVSMVDESTSPLNDNSIQSNEDFINIQEDTVQTINAIVSKPEFVTRKKKVQTKAKRVRVKIPVPLVLNIDKGHETDMPPYIDTTKNASDSRLTAPARKKKTFGERIGNIFKSKRKKLEEAKQIEE